MKEIILYYHVHTDVFHFLKILEQNLNIEIKEIKENEMHQKMVYLLNLPQFQENPYIECEHQCTQSLLYFAFMSDKQLDILLSMLRQAKLPPIPYKAMMTKPNLEYTFIQLYQEIQKEHEAMTKR